MQRVDAVQGVITRRAAQGRGAAARGVARAIARALWQNEAPAAPVEYTRPLVTFVLSLAAMAVGLGALLVRRPSDGVTLALGGVAILSLAASSTRMPQASGHIFNASSLVNLGLAITLGPVGCAVGAASEGLGIIVRYRSGAFRLVFNTTQFMICSLAALGAYTGLSRVLPASSPWLAVAALASGVTFHVANYLILDALLHIAIGRPRGATLRESASVLPYNVVYGYAALGLVGLHQVYGPLGFTLMLAPVAALQGFLIVLSRRTLAHEVQRDQLMERIQEKSIQVERSYDATLVALTHALDARDKETEGHSRRVVEYTRLVAVRLGIGGEDLKILCHGALLHDIGKIGVQDAILHKPGKLTEEEWQVMRRHPEIGAQMVEEVEYLAEARRIILHHHERWDGNGYPLGLKGRQITLGARAFAVADTVDAITQDRPYRRGRSFDVAREELVANRGTQFDPDCVDAFLQLTEADLLAIAAMRARVSVDLLASASTAAVLEPALLRAG